MKELIKRVFKYVGIIDFIAAFYVTVKRLNSSIILKEIKLFLNGTDDNYPLPPFYLCSLVTGHWLASLYYDEGKDLVKNMLLRLRESNIDVSSFKEILDFGCGSGRLLRHFTFLKESKLYGVDISPQLINWCQKKLVFGNFRVNSLSCFFEDEDEKFDFIYAYSVFTHIELERQNEWMAKLRRILKPKGIIYFTTFAESNIHNYLITETEKRDFIINGYLQKSFHGTNYNIVFQTKNYVERNLIKDFSLIAFIPAVVTGNQDAYIISKIE